MPKREDETFQRIYYGGHPPTCNCAECTEARLKRLRREVHPSYVSVCPKCGKKSLWHNTKENKYECLNLDCRAVLPLSTAGHIVRETSRYIPSNKKNKRLTKRKIPNWLIALLLTFSLTIVGLVVSILIGNNVPLWLLLGFSFIFTVERWYSYPIRKHKAISIPYRLFLNLSILSLFALIVWSGVKLFSQQFTYSPLVSSLIFLAELILFIWMCRVVAKNSWRQPSMKLTIFSLICLFVVFSFAGVEPMSSYKNIAIDSIATWFASPSTQTTEVTNTPVPTTPTEVTNTPVTTTPTEQNATTISDYADKFNQFRQLNGLQPLEFTDDLNRIAALRLAEIKVDFSHNSVGNYNQHLGENIAMSTGFLNNSDALNMWENSPGHRANMLDSSYKYTGYAIGGGYAVQVFSEFITINGIPQLPPGWYWAD
jgi:uncharacterized protein YkwD